MAAPKTFCSEEIQTAIQRLASALFERHRGAKELVLLAIANGGIELARRLGGVMRQLPGAAAIKVGTLDISFHRDDIGRHPIPKEFAPTQIPADVQGATVILVDDVLFSGRTVKAALDELFDHGRPEKVELAVLVDRGGRLLPFAADYTGFRLDARATEKVVVTLDPRNPGNDTLQLLPS